VCETNEILIRAFCAISAYSYKAAVQNPKNGR